MVLVGNKCDLEDERVVGKEQGNSLSRQFNCAFMETSAKAKINVNDVSSLLFWLIGWKLLVNDYWNKFLFQIFYDLVRQINKKSPEKKQNKKKKSICALL